MWGSSSSWGMSAILVLSVLHVAGCGGFFRCIGGDPCRCIPSHMWHARPARNIMEKKRQHLTSQRSGGDGKHTSCARDFNHCVAHQVTNPTLQGKFAPMPSFQAFATLELPAPPMHGFLSVVVDTAGHRPLPQTVSRVQAALAPY